MSNNTNILSIETWWANMSGTEHIFWGISIVFSVLFFFQFVLSLFGLDFEADADIEMGDIGEADADAGGFSVDADFALLSVRSIIAFFTFFGWTGTISLGNGASILIAVLSASVAGLIAMFIVAYMLFWFAKLGQAANVNMNETLFKTGQVYLTIPGNREGQGKIHIQAGKSLREVDAMTEHLTAIPTGSRIRVVEVIDDELLIVEPFLN